MLLAAHADGATDIVIAPGTYEIPESAPLNHIVFEHWHDTTIHANGVTIIFDMAGNEPLRFSHCKNVTWDGGKVGFSVPAATQGKLTNIHHDPTESFCDWQIDAGYPIAVDPKQSTFDVIDAATRTLRVGTGDWTPASFERLPAPGAFRLRYRDQPGFKVGDWLVTRAPHGNMTAHLDNCETCTLENLTLFNGGFASFFETGGVGGNRYLKCKIQAGPRPPGATEDQIISSGADGFHSAGVVNGADIEDCSFTGVFLDDCIAIHGAFGRVIDVDGNTLVLKGGGGDPVVGQPLRISDTHGFFGQAMVTAITRLGNGNARVRLDQDLHVPIDHSQDKDEKLGTKANNPMRCGQGYKILRCRLGNTRSRGILVKADNGLVQGCTIEGCGMSGVSIGPEFWWGEANYSWNVRVDHNTFRNCSKNNGDQGTVWVHEDGAMGNRNIMVQGNLMDTCYGRYILRIEGAEGVQVVGNKIAGSFKQKTGSPGNIVWLNLSSEIVFQGNVVVGQGPFAGDVAKLDPSVDEREIKGNDDRGIAVEGSAP